ncbi:hypothetical protein [Enterobacter sp. CC120223-11]|uniref:hypothetical protein n=1 Tax=Enterobacter sp. CC120223-11 TaxID=1378073 RepID=UPI000BE4820D|nr:hypothetical protein [Enterobacter sp. CC120223-11]
MASKDDIRWFKDNFGSRIQAATVGSVFDVDMLTAVACQETGELWSAMRHKGLAADKIVALCCGDTLDADKGRKAFPQTKTSLLKVQKGDAMFEIARNALLGMAKYVPGYAFAFDKPNKFCHGFGMFQYDLQFFAVDPNYFLNREYEIFENTLNRALGELKKALVSQRLNKQTSLSDLQFCQVAICYNTGGFRPELGLKQGYQSGGKYYGEAIRDYLAMARSVGGAAPPGPVTMLLSAAVTATGPKLRVDVDSLPLRLRSAPVLSTPPEANVIATMPDGQAVRAVSGQVTNGFIEIEVMLGGNLFHGYAAAKFLKPDAGDAPQAARQAGKLPEAHLKLLDTLTRRTGIATARSLNEANMPSRSGDTPAELRESLGKIIAWLAVDNPAYHRYAPRDGLTFCNIYAHDYCARAGVYLPRVWWTANALLSLSKGQNVAPLLGNTVDEVRANDLFRWLRDYGESFGWQRAASLDELQQHANLGGVGIIVARRREEGRSGHIVMVVPETDAETAQRNASGAVTLALQSQAGAVNFRYGRGNPDWWKGAQFAEAAFWIHA